MPENTTAGAILFIRLPDNDVSAIGQSGHGRLFLTARDETVGSTLLKDRFSTIPFRRDIYRHHGRFAGAAVTITDLNAILA